MTPEQFEAAYASFQKVVQVLLRLGDSYDEAVDVTQDAYLRAWERRYQLNDESKAMPWIRQIAIHESCNRYRRNRQLTEMPAGFEPRIDPDVNPRALDLQIALARVGAGHRAILQAMLQGRTAREIADGRMTLNAAYQRQARARRQLLKVMHGA